MNNAFIHPLSGDMGIGTITPLAKLHVEGNIYTSGLITASNIRVIGDYVKMDTITSNTEQMVITNDGTGPALKVTQMGANSIAEFYDGDGGAGGILALKIANNGLVGIGTSEPSVALDVVGTVKASSFIGNGSQLTGIIASKWTNSNTNLYVVGSNVGIGTATPRSQLEVAGHIWPSSNVAYDLGSSNLRFRDLYLSGNTIDLGGTRLSRNTETGGLSVVNPLTNAPADTSVGNLVVASNVNIGGNVGVGTTNPQAKLQVVGTVKATSFSGDGSLLTGIVASRWSQSGSNIYVIGSNVGIGTTNPQKPLDIVGDFQATSAYSSSVSYSYDHVWTTRTSAADNGWHCVTWASELAIFVAVAYSGQVMTSPDGITWTLRTSAANNAWISVVWARELLLFVAVAQSGTGNRVMTSSDGITWTSRTSPIDNEWRSVTWAPELPLFVAVAQTGSGNRAMSSPDGITWTARASAVDYAWLSVVWAPTLRLFAAVAYTGQIMTSPNGINWTSRTSPASNAWNSVTWAHELSLFVAVAQSGSGNRVMTSSDGISWTARTSAVDNGWASVTWSPELYLFVAVANSGTSNRVMTSPDGIAWSARTSATANSWLSLTWAPMLSIFVAVAHTGTGDRVMTSSAIKDTITIPGKTLQWKQGNLGINTASPSNALHVVGSIKATSNIVSDAQFLGQQLDSATTPSFSFIANSNTGIFQPAVSNIAISTGGIERMRVVATGSVGIGTTNPLSTLHVNGTAQATTFSGSGASLTALPAASLTGTVSVANGGTGVATITANKVLVGNGTSSILQPTNLHWDNTNSRLGVGTASPVQALDVIGTVKATSFVGDGSLLTGISSTGGGSGTSQWSQSGSNVYIVGSNVGIGTTNPQKPLDIVGDFQAMSVYQNSISYTYDHLWNTRTSAANNDWHSVVWAPELSIFVAVAYSGIGNRVMTSPDGITWTARTSAADNLWVCVTWAPQLLIFVAVAVSGSGNRVMTSPNGITWTARTSAADNEWRFVTWAPELSIFVAVASSGVGNRVMTSPDGITWTIRSSAADNTWFSVTWSSALSIFVAVALSGIGNRVMTSPNGITWTSRTSANDNNWMFVKWAPELSLFVAVASSGVGNRVMTSPNGINWTARTSAADNLWYSVSWAPELSLFVAVAASGTGNRVMTSPDGITWTTRASAADYEWLSIVWAPQLSIFVAVSVSGTGNRVMTSSAIKTTITIPSKMLQWNQGNFGINTASPSNALHVVGDTRIEGNLTVDSLSFNVLSGTTTIVTSPNGNGSVTGQLIVTNDGTGPALVVNQTGAQPVLDIQDDGVSVLKIIDGGNVGVGTTNPQSKLHVIGTVKATSFVGDGSLLTGITSSGSGGGTSQWSQSGSNVYIVGSNVGIGTTNPQAKLHVSSKDVYVGENTKWANYSSSIANLRVSSVDGSINGVNITALNKRTRTSYSAAVDCVRTWTSRPAAANNSWRGLCWSPEVSLFVAVGTSGSSNRVMTSPDGITWTSRTSAADNNWISVCWSPELSLFIAVAESGTGNRVMTSPNGITWTSRASAEDNGWHYVCWSPELSLLVAVAWGGSSNRVMTSPNGIDWTARAPAALNSWLSVCWAAELSLFVAVANSGTGNRVMTSPNGIDWTAQTAPDLSWGAICWSPELLLFVASTSNSMMTSPDGKNWTTRTAAANNNWRAVCWSPQLSLFVDIAWSGTGNRVMSSPDGINWTTRASGADSNWSALCWSPELSLFVAVADNGSGNRVMTSAIGMPNSKSVVKAMPTQMMVDANGNVGIGTTLPQSKLHVNGTAQATTFSGSGASLTALPAASLTGAVSVANGGTGVATITANKVLVGNGTSAVLQPTNLHWDNTNSRLGVGTASPIQALDVIGSIKATSFVGDGSQLTNLTAPTYYHSARIFNVSTPVFNYNIQDVSGDNPTIYVYSGQTYGFALNVSGHPFVIRASNGGANLTIGFVHVAPNGSQTNGNNGYTDGTLYWTVPYTQTTDVVYQCANHSSMVGTIVVLMDTNEGSGTSQWLQSGSNVYVVGSNVGIGTTNPQGPLDVRGTGVASNTGIVIIDSLANMGIGTTNPSASLHVLGSNVLNTIKVDQKVTNSEFPPQGTCNIGAYPDYNDVVMSIDTGTPMTLAEFPPLRLTSATTTAGPITIAVSGAFYGNGNYVVTASSVLSVNYVPWYAFDKSSTTSPDNAWVSGTGTYSTSYPYAALSGGPTIVSGESYTGSFLQIQLPIGVACKRYALSHAEGAPAFVKWILGGSSDGTTWVLLDNQNTAQWESASYVQNVFYNFTVNNNIAYTHYRIIALNAKGSSGITSVREWKIFADIPLTTTSREYPPQSMTSNTMYFNGTYGEGTYVASVSSRYDNLTDAYHVFDKLLTNSPLGIWASAASTYSSGLPTSLSKTTIISGITYLGEYAQLQTPNSIILSSYSVAPRSDLLFYPVDWRLAGSTDGVIWDLIDTQTNKTSWVANVYQNFNISINQSYKYYRFIITKAQTLYEVISLGEIKFFTNQSAYPKYRTALPATATTYSTGTYATYANSIYNATTVDAAPPLFLTEKTLTTPWKTGASNYTSGADASPVPSVFFELPSAIRLSSYTMTSATTSSAPSAWSLYGSNITVAGGWLQLDARTSVVSPWTTALTQTFAPTTTTSTFNFFKFDFLRNCTSGAPGDFISLTELRLGGDDSVPKLRIAVGADGRVGINTPPAEMNANSALTVSGNMTVAGNINAGNMGMFRNRIINGDMRIDQRRAGTSSNVSGSMYFTDRWMVHDYATAVVTAQQMRAPANPYGFPYALSVITTTAQASLAAQEFCGFEQRIEGFNIDDLMWGSQYAHPITISFTAYSTLAGTYSIALRNATNTANYVSTFSVPVANQWVRVEKTIPGEMQATWSIDNTLGLALNITLASGAHWQTADTNKWANSSSAPSGFGFIAATGTTNFAATTNNQFFLTGVQVEKGTLATEFERRSIGVELALCQRYFYATSPGTPTGGSAGTVADICFLSTGLFNTGLRFPVSMRTANWTLAIYQNGVQNRFRVSATGATVTHTGTLTLFINASVNGCGGFYYSSGTELTVGVRYDFDYVVNAEF